MRPIGDVTRETLVATQPESVIRRFGARRLLWGLLILALAAMYVSTFGRMVVLWQTYEYAGHGPFVPLLSALIAWRARDRLGSAPTRGHPAGLGVIALGLGLLAFGSATEIVLLQGLSIVVAVAGMVLLGFGMAALRAMAFPVAFLSLMVPLPNEVVAAITHHLQLFAADFAGRLLGIFGIPFFRQGLVIELPTLTLKVAETCNGLRFLLALLVVTLAFAAVSQRGVWRKIALTAAAVPVAILANAVRVTAIVIAVHYFGPQAAVGTPHHVIGKIVWLATAAPLIALALVLRRGGPPDGTSRPVAVAVKSTGKALSAR